MARKTKQEIEAERLEIELKEERKLIKELDILNLLMTSILNFQITEGGEVIYSYDHVNKDKAGERVTYKNKNLKYLMDEDDIIYKGEIEMDLITGNSEMIKTFIEEWLEDYNIQTTTSIGISVAKFKKSANTPDMYSWGVIIIPEGEDEPINIDSEYFKHRSIGLAQIMFRLNNIKVDKKLRFIDNTKK